MKYFDGNAQAKELDKKISELAINGNGKLAIIQYGDNEASNKYVALKLKHAQRLGVLAEKYVFNSFDRGAFEDLVNNSEITSVIVQLPLPGYVPAEVLDLIPIEKDIDLLSSASKEKFYSGDFSRLPPIILALKHFLNHTKIKTKNTLVVGKGELVGKPVMHYLSCNAIDETTPIENTKIDADLVIMATGKPALLKGTQLKEGASVVDFGSSVVDGITVGDFDLKSEHLHLDWVSPSPGGMGPLVVRYLLLNHLTHK